MYGYGENGNVKRLGMAFGMTFGDGGLEYVFVTSGWDNIPYTTGLTSDDGVISELYPTTSYLTLTEADKGTEVCAYGAKSGYHCGTLNEINVEITVPNP